MRSFIYSWVLFAVHYAFACRALVFWATAAFASRAPAVTPVNLRGGPKRQAKKRAARREARQERAKSSVPKKKKPKPFRATTAVKSQARKAIGMPAPVRREESTKRRKKEKHPPTLGKLLTEGE